MKTKIIVTEEDGELVGEYFLQQGEHLIGRTTDCSIKLKSDHVSREHARLIIGADTLEIEDLGSSWGTFLDDVQIKGRTPIKPTQTLRISDLNFEIESQSLAKMGPTKVEDLPKSVLIPGGGVAEDSQIKEEASEAAEVDLVAVEPDKELEPDPFAKTEKIPIGKNNEKFTKNTGITVVGVLVLGFLLWSFVFRAPTEINLTDLELDQETSTVYLKGSLEPFTGKAVSKYSSGQVKVEIIFSNGKEEGLYSIWYKNGKLLHQADYSSGTFSGSVKWWDEGGALLFESSYVGGKETILKTNGVLSIPSGAIPGITERQN